MKRAPWFAVLAVLLASCAEAKVYEVPPVTVALPTSPRAGDESPMTKKLDLVESVHGTRVADPYRWLENGDAPDVRAWSDNENAHTRKLLDALPGREALRSQVKDLLQIGYVGAPAVRTTRAGGQRYFHTKREGTQNQPQLLVRDGTGGKDRVLLDVSTLSEDGTTALDWWHASRDGALLAWGRSDAGSEESTLHVRDVGTGKDLVDTIAHTRHASVAWLPDGKSFYYSRYPESGSVPPGDEKYFAKIYLHLLGQDAKIDKLVFGDHRDRTDTPIVSISPDGRWLVVRVHMGWDKSEVWIKDLTKTDPGAPVGWVAVAKGAHAVFEPIARNDRLYVQTNDGAPRYKLYAVEYDKVERAQWKELVPEGADVLDDVAILKNEIVTTYMHEASTRIERFGFDGKSHGPIALPGIGSGGVSGAFDGEDLFVSYTSYVVPAQIHHVDLRARPPVRLPRSSSPGTRSARSFRPSTSRSSASTPPRRMARRCPCSSSPRRACERKARTRRCSTGTAAST